MTATLKARLEAIAARDAYRAELRASAARYLRSYLATGLAGMLQCGVDRVRELDITVTAALRAGDRGEVENMALVIENGWSN